MRLAILFDMFGPYHVARIAALNARCQTIGLEVAARSSTYAWQPTSNTTSFERRTLFNAASSSHVSFAQMSHRIAAALDNIAPDALLIPGWATKAAIAALLWAVTRRTPAVAMSESTKGDAGRTVWKEALKRQVVGCFSAGLVGGAPQRDYLASLGLRADAIELGYNAVDNSYFADGANAGRKTADALRARLGLPQHYILASARFIEIKNLVGLLQAYAKFRQLCPDTATHLVLLGDGQLRPVLEAACSQLGLGPYVKLPGFKQYDQLPDYYALADAFVHVSRIEPWGLVVNEAMAAGLPVIVSRSCGCAADLVADGRNGFLVRHDDIEDIANHMKQLDELGPPARQAMRAASRTIVADYSPSRFAAGALAAATTAIRRGPAANGLARRGLLEIAARIV